MIYMLDESRTYAYRPADHRSNGIRNDICEQG